MSGEVTVFKNRTNIITVSLGIDVSEDVITSQIRTEPDVNAPLIAEWTVSFATDGTDGELIFILDNTQTSDIKPNSGYMDINRTSGDEPLPVFNNPLEVRFIGAVTT